MLSKLIDLLSNSLYSAKPQYDDGDITTAKRSVLISLFRKRGFKRVPPVMAQDFVFVVESERTPYLHTL